MTILEKHLELIRSLIKNNQSKKAYDEFSNLIKNLEQNNDENLPSLYYEYAMILFDDYLYEDCLIMLHNAYKNNYMKKEIKEFIFNKFINPNLNEFKTSYNDNLNAYNSQNKYCNIKKIEYKNLPLEFIPLGEDKYYIFDTESDCFNGVINLADEKLKNDIKFEFKDEFSDILIVDNGDLNNISYFLNTDNNKIIYYISNHPLKALSFLKLPNIIDKYLNNVIIFESVDMLYNFFRTNTSIYLPHMLFIGNNDSDINLGKKVQAIINEEHKFRISDEGRNDSNILLSICIPTSNRGHRALDCVMSLLESHYDSEIEIIVSDNNSNKYLDYYKKIENSPDSRIKYYKAESSTPFLGSFCRVLKLPKGKFSLILSDEDKIDLDILPHYMALLKNNPKLALVRSKTSNNYAHLTNEYSHKGNDAFFNFFLKTNYVSGMIYNNEILKKHCLTKFILDNKNNISCFMYPHIWLDTLMTFKGDCCKDDNKLCIEGESEVYTQTVNQNMKITKKDISFYAPNTSISTISNLVNNPPKTSLYQNRIEQHLGFIELLNSLPELSNNLLLTAYSKLCWKTHFLVTYLKPFYTKYKYSVNDIYDEVYNCCVDGIDKLNINIDSEMRDILINNIKEQNQKFRNM